MQAGLWLAATVRVLKVESVPTVCLLGAGSDDRNPRSSHLQAVQKIGPQKFVCKDVLSLGISIHLHHIQQAVLTPDQNALRAPGHSHDHLPHNKGPGRNLHHRKTKARYIHKFTAAKGWLEELAELQSGYVNLSLSSAINDSGLPSKKLSSMRRDEQLFPT